MYPSKAAPLYHNLDDSALPIVVFMYLYLSRAPQWRGIGGTAKAIKLSPLVAPHASLTFTISNLKDQLTMCMRSRAKFTLTLC